MANRVKKLAERFVANLPDSYQRRIVFWHDEEQSFGDIIDELDIPNVKILKLTGTNNFYAKKLLSVDDTSSNYLVYDPCTYNDVNDIWLLDIELYSESFRADLLSMQMDELHIEQNANMRRIMKQYKKLPSMKSIALCLSFSIKSGISDHELEDMSNTSHLLEPYPPITYIFPLSAIIE